MRWHRPIKAELHGNPICVVSEYDTLHGQSQTRMHRRWPEFRQGDGRKGVQKELASRGVAAGASECRYRLKSKFDESCELTSVELNN
ncbi:hypothetical protein BD311DRAFT_754627 [Dichomitus squalens]|uniref:Uncharacterized protein n=1 Tax=Dichomitus squalens TaxID=114155 RepID=A0A4Q9MSQ0_9APHY|nr:hypothetical protein BD311DRAFT_754627 [Dichomitus squalens]